MKNIFLFLSVILFFSCSNDEVTDLDPVNFSPPAGDVTIDISTTREYGDDLPFESSAVTRSSDPFTEIRQVECSESVVVPELAPHIWIGNILTKNSVANCNYRPLIYPRSPITITLTLPGATPATIPNPSYSSFLQYVQGQTARGAFSQNGEFSFTTEQFTSYNELKVAFGSNKKTGMLFWGSSSVEGGEHRSISKATGLYVKFYQTSFKAVMDYPQGQIASIPANLLDSAVYVNSISFGRLGIMSLETNATAEYSKETINRVFRKLFVSGSSTLTTEEQSFLNGCNFKVYLIGGNGQTGVETFTGYNGFIQHVKRGTFSQNEPGSPIFCTFNHVKDNSPMKVNFKFNIKKQPLYIELVHTPRPINEQDWHSNKVKGYGDLSLKFYKNQAKVPVIANPEIKIRIKKTTTDWAKRPKDKTDISTTYYDFQNSGYQTSMLIFSRILTIFHSPARISGPPHDRERDPGRTYNFEYSIEDNSNFVILGTNPINSTNTKFSQN